MATEEQLDALVQCCAGVEDEPLDERLSAQLERLCLRKQQRDGLLALGVRSAGDINFLPSDSVLEERTGLNLVQIGKLRALARTSVGCDGVDALEIEVDPHWEHPVRQANFASLDLGAQPRSMPSPSNMPVVSRTEDEEDAEEEEGDANFWIDWIQKRKKSHVASHVSDPDVTTAQTNFDGLTVQDICDVTFERLGQVFRRYTKGERVMNSQQLSEALADFGFEATQEGAHKLMCHIHHKRYHRELEKDEIAESSFDAILKWLRLAELFTPSAGVVQWISVDLLPCPITCCDYCVDDCKINQGKDDEFFLEFFFKSTRPFARLVGNGTPSLPNKSVRWVHVDAMRGLNALTLLRLAVKYHLHPLAVADVVDNRTMTKFDRYGKNYVLSVDVLSLASELHSSVEPPRVRIHRSHVSMFLAGPPHSDTLLTIHQERSDDSSWLQMWRSASCSDEDSVPEPHAKIWEPLFDELQQKQRRVREEAADFLLYEVLHRIVQQLRPIAEAYAERLGFMHQQKIENFARGWLDEIGEIKLEVYDLVRSVRPMKLVLKHFMEDNIIGKTAQMYLEDVDDDIDAVMQDVEHLTKMAESLEDAHERYRDKRMNDTLFTLSVLSAVFLPLQFFTGWYGMNFTGPDGNAMPELTWEHGYSYFACLEGVSLLASILFILLVNGNLQDCLRGCCGGRRAAVQRRVQPVSDRNRLAGLVHRRNLQSDGKTKSS